ncbi:MAG: DUF3644 domain-containing protein [Chitinophagales bacterium]|nr:DUF3644 domain-containing protein [Chitinophagales bacterium]
MTKNQRQLTRVWRQWGETAKFNVCTSIKHLCKSERQHFDCPTIAKPRTVSGKAMTTQSKEKMTTVKFVLKEYFKTDTNNPIRKNLEFFIPLRNMIEHKSIPEIDSDIFAECQSLLLNYDKIMEKEFGKEYCLRECL